MPRAKKTSVLPTSKQKSNQCSDGLDFVEDGGGETKAAESCMADMSGEHNISSSSKLVPKNSKSNKKPPSKRRKVAAKSGVNLELSKEVKSGNASLVDTSQDEAELELSEQSDTLVESEQGKLGDAENGATQEISSDILVAPLPSSPPPLPPPIPESDCKPPLPDSSESDPEPPSKKRKVGSKHGPDNDESSMLEQTDTVLESEQDGSAFEAEDPTSSTFDTEQLEGSETHREFDVIDDLADAEESDTSGECSSSEEEFIDEREIEAWLEEGVEDHIKRRRQEKQKPQRPAADAEKQEDAAPSAAAEAVVECQKIILKELEHNPFEILPEGWISVTHNSGMPVYLHRESRVCTMSKPYFLGPGSARKHEIPISAIPCLQYRTILKKQEEEAKQAGNAATVNGESVPSEAAGPDVATDADADAVEAVAKGNKEMETNTEDAKLEDGEVPTEPGDAVTKTNDEAVPGSTAPEGDKLEDGELPAENEAEEDAAKEGKAAGASGDAAEAIALATKETVKVQSAKERKKETNLDPEEVRHYCEGLFQFKTLTVRRYKTWKDRRNYVNKDRRNRKRPELPDDTQLITCQVKLDPEEEKMPGKKKAFVINPAGKSHVSILHEYAQIVLRTQPQYVYQEIDNAKTPYGAKVVINGVEYGMGCAGSKKQAKAEAARITLGILIPKMTKILDPKAKEEHDLSYFDEIKVEDPRVAELCVKAGQPTPAHIMVECLKRYHGMGNTQCHMDMKKIKHQKNEFTMKVGKHEVKVICQNKREGKQLAAQAILQKMHPHITCWGSLLRLYGKGCLGAMQKVMTEMLSEEEDQSKVSMELGQGQGQSQSQEVQTESPGQMESKMTQTEGQGQCKEVQTEGQGNNLEVISKEVMAKPLCGNQATETDRVEHCTAEVQAEPSTGSLSVQVERAFFTEEEWTQWDPRILGIGSSAFPSVERATKIMPLKYSTGLYYHRATQTDWRGQSLFHKATQFPDMTYKDADKEAAATGNIQIISPEQAAAAKMLMSTTAMPLASMYSLSVPQPSMMYMGPQMMSPMMPLMSPMMEMGDAYSCLDAGPAADTGSVQEMDTRSCSSEGTYDAQGMSVDLCTSPQLTPKRPTAHMTPPPRMPSPGGVLASPARKEALNLFSASPQGSPRLRQPRPLPQDSSNAPLYPLPSTGDSHQANQQGQSGKQIPTRYSQQRRDVASHSRRRGELPYTQQEQQSPSQQGAQRIDTTNQNQMAAQRRDATNQNQVAAQRRDAPYPGCSSHHGYQQQQLPNPQMAPPVHQPQLPPPQPPMQGQNPYRFMYPGAWYMPAWR